MALGAVFNPHQGRNRLLFLGKAHPKLRDDQPFGIGLSRGGSVHTVLRAAGRCEPVYEAIRKTVAQSDWVVPDETGWRVGVRRFA